MLCWASACTETILAVLIMPLLDVLQSSSNLIHTPILGGGKSVVIRSGVHKLVSVIK